MDMTSAVLGLFDAATNLDARTALTVFFASIVIGFLFLDLSLFNKKSHRIGFRPALYQSIFWIGISIVFGLLIYKFLDRELAVQFLTAYVTEKMLSVDNLFVMMLIFGFFKLDGKYHHRVLFWGILGAIVFRAVFILSGAYIVSRFHWVLYIFGLILIYTGITLLRDKKDEHVDLEKNGMLRAAQKFLPVSQEPHEGKFFTRENGKLKVTTLFVIMLVVEQSDLLFAVDSIPAVFSISQDAFIVFTSNIFAVMGLRSLFFLLENILSRFRHLQKGLAVVLLFIGGKMLAVIAGVHIDSMTSFLVILLILSVSILVSVPYPRKRPLPFVKKEVMYAACQRKGGHGVCEEVKE